ncbi:hypothetical protein [Accumulibacter sp.]|uniref:hypothetical protein n=1 Tax=Accumulibacter sp. TaxID=2053492 RepID=UPI0026274CDC|nr:hypothetical protein [Accumulibacter sp.]
MKDKLAVDVGRVGIDATGAQAAGGGERYEPHSRLFMAPAISEAFAKPNAARFARGIRLRLEMCGQRATSTQLPGRKRDVTGGEDRPPPTLSRVSDVRYSALFVVLKARRWPKPWSTLCTNIA